MFEFGFYAKFEFPQFEWNLISKNLISNDWYAIVSKVHKNSMAMS